MKKFIGILGLIFCLTSCNVTETVVFNEDGSGEFLVSYDMGEAMQKMMESMGSTADKEDGELGKVMDTTMVFKDLMVTYKDSIAELPKDKQMAFEAVQDMYMKMHMDEDKGIFNFGVGMAFNSIEDLKNIQEKIRTAQSLNGQNEQVSALKSGSPLGKFMGDDQSNVSYDYTENGFSRTTIVSVEDGEAMKETEQLFDENDETDQQFMEYFENAFYNVKLVFPKAVKSTNIEGAVISEDGKTVTYKANWIDFIKDPKRLDIDVKFANE